MTEVFEFTLLFKLPDAESAPETYLDALYEAGCSDATIGTGKDGVIALNFDRESESYEAAVKSAESNVLAAIPGAKMVR